MDRDSQRWFRAARGQFQIHCRQGGIESLYQPGFIAEADEAILMLESKAARETESDEVRLKAAAAVEWCRHATAHAVANGGKPWRYALIPHDIVEDNMSLAALAHRFEVSITDD